MVEVMIPIDMEPKDQTPKLSYERVMEDYGVTIKHRDMITEESDFSKYPDILTELTYKYEGE